MKLTVERTDLLRALTIAERGVNAKSPIPIYGALMLEATADQLRVTGTDGEVTLTAACLATVDKPGKTAVLAANCGAILRGLAGDTVSLALDKTQLTLAAGRSRYKVSVLTGEAWPPVPVVASTWSCGVNAAALALGLGRVLPAVRQDTDRPTLCGVFFEGGPEGLTLVATDTLRLHLARVSREPLPAAGFILGGGAARQLLRVLEGEGGVTLTTDGATLRAVGDWGVFLGQLIAGDYLNYQRFIGPAATSAEFGQRELADAVRRAGYVAQGCADRLLLAAGATGTATLTARSEAYGEAEEALAMTAAAPFEALPISSRYLGQALSGFQGGTVCVLRGTTHRGLRLESPESDDYFAVVMPMSNPNEE